LKLCALAYEMMEMGGENEIDASYILDATPEVAV
jgi:hypothetical protein